MNRDAVLATIIGFGVGLIIAGLVFLGPALFKDFRIQLPDISFVTRLFQGKQEISPMPTPNVSSDGFTIDSPLPEAIESQEESLVSGSTKPGAIVVIIGEDSETVVEANKSGAYAGKIPLIEGKNNITVTSYAKDDIQSNTLVVYYTPETF